MISWPGPTAALVALPVPPDRDGILRTLVLEDLVLARLDGVLETIPAFSTLLVLGEVERWDPDRVEALLPALITEALAAPLPAVPEAVVDLPACYDPGLGPDLVEWAARSGLSVEEAAALHSGREYTVLATGFSPGFAYLGDLDERLAMPRRPSPRPRVEAGSIGIADRRTAVYPSSGPGGWQLVGRVPAALFREAEQRLGRFSPGARVRFRQIDGRTFEAES